MGSPLASEILKAIATNRSSPSYWQYVDSHWESKSYGELEADISRGVAAYQELQNSPTTTPHRVGLLLNRSYDLLSLLLAAVTSSFPFVLLDVNWPHPFIVKAVQTAAVTVLVTIAPFDCHELQRVVVVDPETFMAKVYPKGVSDNGQFHTVTSLDEYTVCTSGSTKGYPEPVSCHPMGILNRLQWMSKAFPSEAGEVRVWKSSTAFVDSLAEILDAVIGGAAIVAASKEEMTGPYELFTLLQMCPGVRRILLTPSFLEAMLPVVEMHGPSCVSHIKTWFVSGEELKGVTARRFFKTMAVGARLVNLYGCAEVAGDASCFVLERPASFDSVPIGPPIDNVEMSLAEDGELLVRPTGKNLFSIHAEGPICTGDLCKRASDGSLVWIGRKSRQVKIRGQYVNPSLVETTISQMEEVQQCGVTALSQEHCRLHASVVLTNVSSPPDICQKIRRHVLESLPLVCSPNSIHIVASLPVLASGKVDYDEIRKSALRRKGVDSVSFPCTSISKGIAQKMSLLIQNGPIGVHDDFFEMGGDSIMLGVLCADLKIPLSSLWSDGWEKISASGLAALAQQQQVFPKHQSSSKGRVSQHIEARPLKLRKTANQEWISISRGNAARTEWPLLPQSMRLGAISKVAWKVKTLKCVDASPTISGRLVDGQILGATVFVGSHDHKFYAISADNGDVLWSTTLGDRIESSACVAGTGEWVCVGCYDGFVYFLERENGKVIYKVQSGHQVKSSPVYDSKNGIVWVGSHSGDLLAIDFDNRNASSLKCDGSIYATPCIDSTLGRVYVPTHGCTLVAAEYQNGCVLEVWKTTMPCVAFSSPVLAQCEGTGIIVFGGVNGYVYGYCADGRLLWQVETGGPCISSPCLVSVTTVAIGSDDGCIHLIDVSNGTRISLHFPEKRDRIFASPFAVRNGFVYAATVNGTLFAVDVSAGCVQAETIELPGQTFSSPIVAGNRLFIGCRDDCVYAIDLK